MTYKVQKIREEVERLKGWNNNVRNSTRHMTLQEEDFNRGKHSSYLEILNFIDSLQDEPVSDDLEEAAKHYLYSNILYDDVYVGNPTDKDCIEMFKAGAKWKERQMIEKAVDADIVNNCTLYGYVARNIDGSLNLFEVEPKRIEDKWWDRDYHSTILDNEAFPELKWEDAPIYVRLVIFKEG